MGSALSRLIGADAWVVAESYVDTTPRHAYLYFGPRDRLLNEPATAEVFLDRAYLAELRRRASVLVEGLITNHIDPDKVLVRDADQFRYRPEQSAN